MQNREKFVLTVPLLTDARGVKIGKTEGNVIGLTDPATEFYAKIMSLGDDAIVPSFTLLTDKPMTEITAMKEKMENGENPMTFKKQLAFELTKWLHNESEAQNAQAEFEKVHQKGDSQDVSAPVFETDKSHWNRVDLLVAAGLVTSKSEAKRLVEQHAVDIDGVSIESGNDGFIDIKNGSIIKVGKKKFAKIKIL
jgi:tyrosyl-tRNA synthetase